MSNTAESVVVRSVVTRRNAAAVRAADAALVRRHQAALREIERWEVARQSRPHVPMLANDVLRRDDLADVASPIPSFGPRTGTHPMATRVDPEPPRPMATRIRPSLMTADEAAERPDRFAEAMGAAASALLISGCILAALYLGSR
jgi:hypothetical protein